MEYLVYCADDPDDRTHTKVSVAYPPQNGRYWDFKDFGMVEVARYYISFLCGESCGKCTPCREGLRQMLQILTDICEGRGTMEDLDLLEELGEMKPVPTGMQRIYGYLMQQIRPEKESFDIRGIDRENIKGTSYLARIE